MGFNFRKRIRLGKNISLNLGKSGLNVSFGRKGFRQSVNTKGQARTTFSIPGTGLSYTKTVSAKSLIKKLNRNSEEVSSALDVNPANEVKEFEAGILQLTTLHYEADYDRHSNWKSLQEEVSKYTDNVDGPNVAHAKKLIESNKPGFFSRILGSGKFKKESEQLIKEAEILDLEEKTYWLSKQRIAESMQNNDMDTTIRLLEEMKISDVLAEYIDSFKIHNYNDTDISASISMEPMEYIPDEFLSLTPTGKLSKKKYTKTDYYDLTSQFVTAVIFRTAHNLFNLFPVHTIFLLIEEKKVNEVNKQMVRMPILSIQIDRETFQKIRLNEVNPFSALTNFIHEVDFLKTKGFQEISVIDQRSGGLERS